MPNVRKTVLVVEDDLDTQHALSNVLLLEGYQVRCADHGEAALSAIAGRPSPDLIVLDLMMPVLNGWGFLHRLAADPVRHRIPVVVLSAYGDLDRHTRGLPVCACLAKPIDLDRLLAVVAANTEE